MGIAHCSCVQKEADCDSGLSPGVTTVYDDLLPPKDERALEQSLDVQRRESSATLPATLHVNTDAEQAMEDATEKVATGESLIGDQNDQKCPDQDGAGAALSCVVL